MDILDRRYAQLSCINLRLRQAKTWSEALHLLRDQYRLEQELQPGVDELNRLARGWVFVEPPRTHLHALGPNKS